MLADFLEPEAGLEITTEDSLAAKELLSAKPWELIERILRQRYKGELQQFLFTSTSLRDYAWRQGFLAGYRAAIDDIYRIRDNDLIKLHLAEMFRAGMDGAV